MSHELAGYLSLYGYAVTIIRPLMIAAILMGLWVALRRTELSPAARTATWVFVALSLVAWYVLILNVAQSGVLETRAGARPYLPLAIFVPLFVGLPIVTRSKRIGAVLDSAPAGWLVGLQVYRIVGGNFVVLWSFGALTGVFALPAGLGDVLVGGLALPAAFYFASGGAGGRGVLIAWNILGVVDLISAITLGFLTSPGPLQRLALENPNLLTSTYPSVMTPAFAVPLSLILHTISLRQLLRLRRNVRAQERSTEGMASAA